MTFSCLTAKAISSKTSEKSLFARICHRFDTFMCHMACNTIEEIIFRSVLL